MDNLLDFLESEYGIGFHSFFPASMGFSTKAAYRVTSIDGMDYFLKIYDKSLPTTRFFVDRIDTYMPVLDWLSHYPTLNGRILTPIPTRHGAYKTEAEDDVYVLFLYVHGNVPGQGMTREQTAELGEILALLHDAGDMIPFEAPELTEDISLSFCGQLSHFLDDPKTDHRKLIKLISPHIELLRSAILETLNLRDTIRSGYSPLVLCHGDAHGNNVIQSSRLVLADWEDLRRAPAEADLFIQAWHPYGETLLEAYSTARRGYIINHELLYFYTIRRRIEDVWVDVQRLTEESPDEAETIKLLDYIRQGIEEVQKLYLSKH